MLAETILGLALVFVVIGTVVLVRALLPRSCPVPGVERVTVLRCSGDAAGLEAAIREPWDTKAQIFIVDAGMTAEALKRAEILALRYGAEIRKETPRSACADGFPAGSRRGTEPNDTGSADGREQN